MRYFCRGHCKQADERNLRRDGAAGLSGLLRSKTIQRGSEAPESERTRGRHRRNSIEKRHVILSS